MNKEYERITYDEFMAMFKYAPRMCYTLYEKAEDEIDKLKKQKDDVVEYIKKNILIGYDKYGFDKNIVAGIVVNDLLRMLGETNEFE